MHTNASALRPTLVAAFVAVAAAFTPGVASAQSICEIDNPYCDDHACATDHDCAAGDVCETGVCVEPTTPEALVAAACPCDDAWKNHGHYIRCVVLEVHALELTSELADDLVAAAARGECGAR